MPGNVVIMLIFQLKELIKVKNVKPCSFFSLSFSPFFCDNAKKLGRSDDAKRRKNGGCPFNIVIWPQSIKI